MKNSCQGLSKTKRSLQKRSDFSEMTFKKNSETAKGKSSLVGETLKLEVLDCDKENQGDIINYRRYESNESMESNLPKPQNFLPNPENLPEPFTNIQKRLSMVEDVLSKDSKGGLAEANKSHKNFIEIKGVKIFYDNKDLE